MSHRVVTLLALCAPAAVLSACIRDVGPGPDPGPCADVPSGVYTWGEIGIGSCLSGPSDMTFVEQGDRTWLAVVNANPYLDFQSGSLLLVDMDSVDWSARDNRMDQLATSALPLPSYAGGVGHVADRDLLLVSGRLSDGYDMANARDDLWVIDASDPSAVAPWSEGDAVTLRADPQPVVVHGDEGLAYVVNLTDRSISVVDTTTTPLTVLDTGRSGSLTHPRFFDVDGSGSTAQVHGAAVLDDAALPSDTWTLTRVDASTRLWIPEAGGLARWDTGGLDLVRSGSGLALDPATSDFVTEVRDPRAVNEGGLPVLYYANDGAIERLPFTFDGAGTTGWQWDRASAILPAGSGWDAVRGAPSPVFLGDASALYYDGRSAPGASASIGLALRESGAYAPLAEPVVEAPAGFESIEDPFVRVDAGIVRMWTSLFDGERWSVGLTESTDGVDFSDVSEVLALDDADIAAPTVVRNGARYELWAAVDTGDGWGHAKAWSWDGRTWHDVEVVLGPEAPSPEDPPRLAALVDGTHGWAVEGANAGPLTTLARDGSTWSAPDRWFSLRTASGHDVGHTALGPASVNGLTPGSVVDVDGVPTLYVTGLDAGLRPSLAALQPAGAGWEVVARDLVPEGQGGNAAGASDPVVWATDSGFEMVYAATDASGTVRMRRASSVDGLSWEPSEGQLLDDAPDWDSASRVPHSVDFDGDRLRVWYTGSNGSRTRIGAAVLDGNTFERQALGDLDWQLGPGDPGSFDDSGVRDPMVLNDGDDLHLWYAGFDGEAWSIGYATRPVGGGPWTRPERPLHTTPQPVLSATPSSFSAGGVHHPVVRVTDTGELEVYYAGTDGAVPRIGRAVGDERALYATQRFPTADDELVFRSERGGGDRAAIDLGQSFDGLTTSGSGIVGATLDEERGFLYLTSPQAGYITVIDVRDDSVDGFVDANYLDVEAALVADGITGFRDVVVVPGRDRLYATGTGPEVLVAFDLTELADDDAKQAVRTAPVATFSMQALTTPTNTPNRFGQRPRRNEDEGIETGARVGGAGLALSEDGRYLYATHFRDNAVLVYDLSVGAYGSEIRRITDVGENPHVVRLTPDGRHAVVAAYIGELVDGAASSRLSVIDADPASPTFLQVVTRLVNRGPESP